MSTTPSLSGRLSDANMTVQDDPRTLPDLAKILKDLKLGGHSHTPLQDTSNLLALEPSIRKLHEGFSALYENLPNDLPEDQDEAGIEQSEITVESHDGHMVEMYVFRPKSSGNEPLPAICYIHGGGMTVLDTANKVHLRWCNSLALQGTVVFAINFRNAWGSNGEHRPFPTGLNDCAAAVKYVAAHKAELGISKAVVQGESGGGNLALATALKANQEGWIDIIDGVYACVPVTNAEACGWSREERLKSFPSLVECEGYLLNLSGVVEHAVWYTPKETDQKSPLAWPDHATEKDLKGLPPHIISVDELDPLRDEGIAYFRKLAAARVQATAEVNLGITHATSLIFRQALPQVHRKAVRQIVAFANSL